MGGILQIPLTKGYVAIVDAEDFDAIAPFSWRAWKSKTGKWYARTTRWSSNEKKKKHVEMTRLILGAPQNILVDHKDGNSLDNRRQNLRLATKAQNCRNRSSLNSNNTSGHRGVYWHKRSGRWLVCLQFNGRLQHVGYFHEFPHAVEAQKKASLKLYGEFSPEVRP